MKRTLEVLAAQRQWLQDRLLGIAASEAPTVGLGEAEGIRCGLQALALVEDALEKE